jgi:hypothetical protein
MLTRLVPSCYREESAESPHDFVGLLGLIGTPRGIACSWPVDRVRQFGDRSQRQGHADRPFDAR